LITRTFRRYARLQTKRACNPQTIGSREAKQEQIGRNSSVRYPGQRRWKGGDQERSTRQEASETWLQWKEISLEHFTKEGEKNNT